MVERTPAAASQAACSDAAGVSDAKADRTVEAGMPGREFGDERVLRLASAGDPLCCARGTRLDRRSPCRWPPDIGRR
jgi:hypothetical protein